MRIGADGSYLRWTRTGTARYLDGLLHAIEARLGEDEFLVYYNSTPRKKLFGERVRERFTRMPNRTLWNQVRLPFALLADRCDVYLGGAQVVPRAPGPPSVLVLHDLLGFRDPSAKPGADGRYWRRWTRASARRAAAVIAISEHTAGDCQRYLGVPAEKIRIVYQGVSPAFTKAASAAEMMAARSLLEGCGWRGDRCILQVGAYERHKGGDVVAGAVAELRRQGRTLTLVQCGPSARKQPPVDGVIRLGMVDDEILRALYAIAEAVCVASTHEGFGLPAIEAIAMGTPVVAAPVGGLPEAGGDVAIYAASPDAEGFATALASLLDDPMARRKGQVEGRRRTADFTWDRCAEAVLGILHDIGDRGA